MHTQTTVGRSHRCMTAQHWLRSPKNLSSHHVTYQSRWPDLPLASETNHQPASSTEKEAHETQAHGCERIPIVDLRT